ncbi:MAG TPA: GGDEF domain-containing protein [Afipia sp.]|uniref:putative bifunctional diguanylate cyclase/phosphodiesterase n=1 Tax=unclassified Afipia TaxID=2642050 RepID=UPI000464140A|nr:MULTISPECIES: EAL domain-containing protein [unclassified Afipia]MAH70783.1 GGDEF-domain containing protein [Afipia sp.]OUX60214.1 MAG: GGDEF-domain containing protein [Afipia sp. TMED4]HAO40426.1 GGDEF-domain containing protein [Afipia sp.]HAP13094.1 GGDEF-domain containing protein [Afipia sp.]HAP48576.1 GGDEF-domain containing protein [Afipia sp.]
MQLLHQKKSPDEETLSPSIYAALVDSMCQNSWPMLFGAICAAAAALMTALKTGYAPIWPCAVLIITIGIARAIQMRKYEKRTTVLSPEQAADFEPRYMLGAMLYAGVLGLWCAIVLLGTDDPIAHMLCTTVTIAYTGGGAARNYGRPRIVQLHILLSCGPMSLALAVHGDLYHIGLAGLLVLFFLGLKDINLSLHSIFVKALLANEREASIAAQFDTALNNMPHGLCMFDANGCLAVMNYRFHYMMGLKTDLIGSGASAAEVVAACLKAGTLTGANADTIIAQTARQQQAEIVTLYSTGTEERALAWTFEPMADGGTVVLVEDITARRNAEAKIGHMARFDELTGLPNRVHFRDEIGQMLNSSRAPLSALLFIDLDQFKQVNDTLGHPSGDKLLCAVTARLRRLLRPEDFVARFGGDEFVVFQRGIQSTEDAASLARRIVDRLSERYEIDHHLVEIGASIGIAMTSAETSVDILLKNADMALYRAKADGRGTFCFFREEMAHTVETRRVLELDLRHALAHEEFELYYQPLVNLKSGRISTCEALLRWNHPTRGAVSPAEIIPVVEDMGLVVDLGRWILRKACMECMKWPDPVSVAVNFSPQQFHQRDVMTEVRYALEVSGLPAHRLEIEITESSLLRNTQWTLDVLTQLREAGVRISLDDFGTGYSSLSYLHNFPLQKVKIDRSFLEDIGSQRPLTLLRGVARLSADLGMSVVVEGIETNEQLELISAEGTVTEAQGFLFSRPVPAARVRELLKASHGTVSKDVIPIRQTLR